MNLLFQESGTAYDLLPVSLILQGKTVNLLDFCEITTSTLNDLFINANQGLNFIGFGSNTPKFNPFRGCFFCFIEFPEHRTGLLILMSFRHFIHKMAD